MNDTTPEPDLLDLLDMHCEHGPIDDCPYDCTDTRSDDRIHLLNLEAFAHRHEPTTFWHPCYLCERKKYLRQLSERRRGQDANNE